MTQWLRLLCRLLRALHLCSGQGYTDGRCSDYLFTVYDPGTECWKSGGSGRASSVNWFHGSSKRSAKFGDNATECAPPTSFNYVDPSGQSKSIKVGSSEAAEAIAAAYDNGKFDTLASYPPCGFQFNCILGILVYVFPVFRRQVCVGSCCSHAC